MNVVKMGAKRSGRALVKAFMLASVLTFAAPFAFVGETVAQDIQVSLGGGRVTRVAVRPGTTSTVRTNAPFADLVIGNPSVADVVPLSDRSFYIQGKANGFTNISIYDANKNLMGVVDVRVEQSANEIASAVAAAVPGADVQVSMVGGRIKLSGIVANGLERERALQAAAQFTDQPVISALAVSDTQQVNLEVRVLEASRGAGRDLGIKFDGYGRSSKFTSGTGIVTNVDPDTKSLATFVTDDVRLLNGNTPFGTLVAQVLKVAGFQMDAIIEALETKGLARRLAQPNLTSVSGEAAKFHAGGEIPVPTLTDDGIGYTYRPYGVVLEFVPTVLEDSKINIRVRTEVSEIDRSIAVNGNPAFTSRKAEAVMELRDGQSFAMAGLLQSVNQRDIQQIPWLGNIPILGALFRSTSYQKKETDLVIVVTPRLVRPAAPDEPLYSPLDTTRPTNDPELFLLGIMEVDKDMIRKFKEGEGVIGAYGHRLDLEFEEPYVAKK